MAAVFAFFAAVRLFPAARAAPLAADVVFVAGFRAVTDFFFAVAFPPAFFEPGRRTAAVDAVVFLVASFPGAFDEPPPPPFVAAVGRTTFDADAERRTFEERCDFAGLVIFLERKDFAAGAAFADRADFAEEVTLADRVDFAAEVLFLVPVDLAEEAFFAERAGDRLLVPFAECARADVAFPRAGVASLFGRADFAALAFAPARFPAATDLTPLDRDETVVAEVPFVDDDLVDAEPFIVFLVEEDFDRWSDAFLLAALALDARAVCFTAAFALPGFAPRDAATFFIVRSFSTLSRSCA